MNFPRHAFISMLVACAVFLLLATCMRFGNIASRNTTMKPSITYLRLLRHTPFFTALDTAQLRWAIDHSREWEAQNGSIVAECDNDATTRDDAYWILLDGHWEIEHNGHTHASGHADPGKWFSTTEATTPCRLVTTEHSYVMRIARADMDEMLKRGFDFRAHLQAGHAYYGEIFGSEIARPNPAR